MGLFGLFGGSDSPDYRGAAEQTQASNADAWMKQLQANRPNQTNPYGSSTWSKDANGNWTQNTSYNPAFQGIFDNQARGMGMRAQAATDMTQTAVDALRKGVDYAGLGKLDDGSAARDQAISSAYGQATSRLDPRFQQEGDALESKLANQGLDPTSQAAQTAQANFGRERNDAYNGAMASAISQGTAAGDSAFRNNLAARQQNIGEQQGAAMQGFNAMNALNGSAQLGPLQFNSFLGAGGLGGVDYLGAAQAKGNFDLQNDANNNAMLGGLLSAGGKAAASIASGGFGGFG